MKSITVLMFCWFLFTANLIGKKPTQEMYQSKIVCDILTNVTLEELEEFLNRNKGNKIEYEIYENNEIILDIKSTDNLTKKTHNTRFKFTFVQEKNESGLICGGGNIDGNSLSSRDVRLYFIGLVEQEKSIKIQEFNEQERLKKLEQVPGKYKGHFIDGDDTDEKLDFELLLIKINNGFEGKIYYNEEEFDIKNQFMNGITWFYPENEINIKLNEFYAKSSKNTLYEIKINGKLENNVISGTATIKKEKNIFITKVKSEKNGTIYLTKVD